MSSNNVFSQFLNKRMFAPDGQKTRERSAGRFSGTAQYQTLLLKQKKKENMEAML